MMITIIFLEFLEFKSDDKIGIKLIHLIVICEMK